eukprot:CAMPEP_0114627636 /NCGR_PEP_ID=MMETSP0168-20121206/12401_1 /TAXON_ID=95228 ORGANISM="Vannella sp., Strain DIVA3 517/6/12" /NCGR_SAMPLE_ID=MMETSP0168 /ASSEMBLY_ACC=CAM_ASM_000044 /LENGTH=132 /DNA_ID=CAMNT_0001838981 /DNA_START=127 /DNA_END=525 /DNA_ORIENTATION=+
MTTRQAAPSKLESTMIHVRLLPSSDEESSRGERSLESAGEPLLSKAGLPDDGDTDVGLSVGLSLDSVGTNVALNPTANSVKCVHLQWTAEEDCDTSSQPELDHSPVRGSKKTHSAPAVPWLHSGNEGKSMKR